MTDRRELDPTPDTPWRPASSPGIRRMALEATRAAVEAAKDKRKKPAGEQE